MAPTLGRNPSARDGSPQGRQSEELLDELDEELVDVVLAFSAVFVEVVDEPDDELEESEVLAGVLDDVPLRLSVR
ncbi:hypothetical protein GCM10027600_02190 [Nocardioides ginsengisegetis]